MEKKIDEDNFGKKITKKENTKEIEKKNHMRKNCIYA
jgi:hypothetical protein